MFLLPAIRPHGPDLPVIVPDGNMEYSSDSKHSDMTVVTRDDAYKSEEDDQPVTLTLAEPNYLTQYLNLSKESGQLVGSCLRNICWLQEQRSTGVETVSEN